MLPAWLGEIQAVTGQAIWNPDSADTLDKILQNCIIHVFEHGTDMYAHVYEFINMYVHVHEVL